MSFRTIASSKSSIWHKINGVNIEDFVVCVGIAAFFGELVNPPRGPMTMGRSDSRAIRR